MTSRRDVPARVSAGGMIHPGREIALRSPRPRQRGRNESRASCGSRPTLRRNLAARTAQRAVPTCRKAVVHHRHGRTLRCHDYAPAAPSAMKVGHETRLAMVHVDEECNVPAMLLKPYNRAGPSAQPETESQAAKQPLRGSGACAGCDAPGVRTCANSIGRNRRA